MHLLVRVVPEVRADGIYLNVYGPGLSHDVVGPLVDGVEVPVVLEPQDPTAGRAPPSMKVRRRANMTEKQVAKDTGGRVQPASGAMAGAKGDTRTRGELRTEIKTSRGLTYELHRHELNKIRSETGPGEVAVFIVQFINKQTHREEDMWAVLPYEDWQNQHEAHINRRPKDWRR